MVKQTSTNPFILGLIIALGFIVGLMYYQQTSADEPYDIPLPVSIRDDTYIKFKDLRFDLSIFQNQNFSSLRTFGEFPVDPGFTGKRDLFAP